MLSFRVTLKIFVHMLNTYLARAYSYGAVIVPYLRSHQNFTLINNKSNCENISDDDDSDNLWRSQASESDNYSNEETAVCGSDLSVSWIWHSIKQPCSEQYCQKCPSCESAFLPSSGVRPPWLLHRQSKNTTRRSSGADTCCHLAESG